MIVTRTPFRASYVGGGSDVRWFYQRNGHGAVLSSSLGYYMYIVMHSYFYKDRIRLKYSQTEEVVSVDDIEHRLLRACLQRFGIKGGIEIASFADVPAGTGLGSSSAFTVGLLNALHAWQGRVVSKQQLAEEACEMEIDVLGNPIGKQDQYGAAFGGTHQFQFNRDESVSVTPVLLTSETNSMLQKNLRLYALPGTRSADEILERQNSSQDRDQKFENIRQLTELVGPLKGRLESGDPDSLGELLHVGWEIKQRITAGISSDQIDGYYKKALNAGAIGGKLLGAGGCGFLLIYAKDHDAVGAAIGLESYLFTIDPDGTKIIFYEPPH